MKHMLHPYTSRYYAQRLLMLALVLGGLTSGITPTFYIADRPVPSRAAGSATTYNMANMSGQPLSASAPSVPDDVTSKRVNAAYAQLPLQFEVNRGQAPAEVKYLSRGPDYTLFLTATGARLTLPRKEARREEVAAPSDSATLRMQMVGANPRAAVTGVDELPGRVNYIRGQDRKQWRTGIPTYARVRYTEVYPGVDLIYYGNGHHLEYDFVVAVGADPRQIRLAFTGAEKLEVDAGGGLVLHTVAGEIRQPKPVVYQEVDGRRRAIAGDYLLTGAHQVGFAVGGYDPARPLVIDPVLVYSTYFGGSGEDVGMDIAVDDGGNAYVTGTRPSVRGQDFDAFVAKFSPGGALLWVTDLGDRCDDLGRGIAVDSQRNAYLTGQIGTICFPYPELRPGAFVAKLDGETGGMLYLFPFSSEFSSSDIGQAVAVDSSLNTYVTGVTGSVSFPVTPGALQPVFGGGIVDGFVVKVNAAGSELLYATYLGGDWSESANDIAVNGENAYVTGSTSSRDFPTTRNAFQPTHRGWGPTTTNAFISKLNAAGSALLYSTYLGGRFDDVAQGIAVDSAGNAYVSGVAESDDFPTTEGSFQPDPADNRLCFFRLCTDAFVTKIDPSQPPAQQLVYSTYLGGRIFDEGSRIDVDAAGNAYLTGMTNSSNFPTRDAFQPNLADEGQGDAFVAKLNADGSALIYSSYLGGGRVVGTDPFEGVDVGTGIAVDSEGNAYVTGQTYSANFPVTDGAHQPTYGGGVGCGFPSTPCGDAFVVKIAAAGTPPRTR